MPPPLKGLQHIALKVRDLGASVRFYTEVLGFRVTERHGPGEAPGYVNGLNFITCTNKHHVVNLVALAPESRPEAPPPPEPTRRARAFGLHHFAFEVEDKAAFLAWERHLRARGVAIEFGPLVHSPTHPEGDGSWGENRAMYFSDPDGHSVEIFCDMAALDAAGGVDPAWHAERLRRDGHDPAAAPPPPIKR